MPTTCSKRFAELWVVMATEIKLPRLGQGMESGTIVKWLKSEGDKVEKGEPLYELDTDKVTQEVEAEASGVLLKIAISSGEVEVGRTIAVIGEQGEQVKLEPSEPAGNGSAALEVSGDPVEEGSPARAASTSVLWRGPGPTVVSLRRTSSAPLPREPRSRFPRRRWRAKGSRCSSCRRCAKRSRAGSRRPGR